MEPAFVVLAEHRVRLLLVSGDSFLVARIVEIRDKVRLNLEKFVWSSREK
jgi:hypothetical protein